MRQTEENPTLRSMLGHQTLHDIRETIQSNLGSHTSLELQHDVPGATVYVDSGQQNIDKAIKRSLEDLQSLNVDQQLREEQERTYRDALKRSSEEQNQKRRERDVEDRVLWEHIQASDKHDSATSFAQPRPISPRGSCLSSRRRKVSFAPSSGRTPPKLPPRPISSSTSSQAQSQAGADIQRAWRISESAGRSAAKENADIQAALHMSANQAKEEEDLEAALRLSEREVALLRDKEERERAAKTKFQDDKEQEFDTVLADALAWAPHDVEERRFWQGWRLKLGRVETELTVSDANLEREEDDTEFVRMAPDAKDSWRGHVRRLEEDADVYMSGALPASE